MINITFTEIVKNEEILEKINEQRHVMKHITAR